MVGVGAIVPAIVEGKVLLCPGGDDAQLQRSFDLFEQVPMGLLMALLQAIDALAAGGQVTLSIGIAAIQFARSGVCAFGVRRVDDHSLARSAVSTAMPVYTVGPRRLIQPLPGFSCQEHDHRGHLARFRECGRAAAVSTIP